MSIIIILIAFACIVFLVMNSAAQNTTTPTTMIPTTTIIPTTTMFQPIRGLSPVPQPPVPQPPASPAFINLTLFGREGQNTITLKFSSSSNSSDISWNIPNIEFTVAPNSYIYIGSSNTPSIPAATKLKDSTNLIKYELRGFSKQILSSTGAAESVSIFMVNNNYVIRPNLRGNELYEKTGLVGEWSFTIMASL